MVQASPMLRLLQGDVGAGKTVVALEAMLAAVEAGAQAALLAPTEILARQHFETLRKMAAPTGVAIELLTGRDKGQGPRGHSDGAGRWLGADYRRHPCDLPGFGELPATSGWW